jgi:hypothetical protein
VKSLSSDLVVPALIIGAALTIFSVVGFFTRPSQADFTMFYDSGLAWLEGRAPYTHAHANLNPPLVVAAVFAPLARLPYKAAQAVWFAASVLAFLLSLRVVARTLQLNRPQLLGLLAALSVTYPWCLLWFGGQVTFLLMYPFSRAWAALRSGAEVSAGVWLAAVIVFKPPFALLALALPMRTWIVAGVISASASGAAVLWTGWEPWRAWLAFGGEVRWLSWADNASLWGVFTRAQSGWLGGGTLNDVPAPGWVLLALVATLGFLRTVREGNADRRVALAIVWLLLVLPLGWVYYLPLAAGALYAVWTHSRWAWASLVMCCVPVPLIYPLVTSRWRAATLGSVYAIGLICAWLALGRRPASAEAPTYTTLPASRQPGGQAR